MTTAATIMNIKVTDEGLAAEIEALACLHCGGDVNEFANLLLLRALRPDQFAAEMSARNQHRALITD